MADEPASVSLDFLDEDIPVIDQSGKTRLVKGSDFVDIEFAVPGASGGPSAPPAKPPTPPPPQIDTLATVRPEDAREIAKVELETPKKIDAETTETVVSLLTGMVDEAVTVSGVKLENEDMQRRFRNLLALYFRDLRDGMETQSKLTMPAASGGMGMTDQEAERVMSVMKMKNGEFHSAMTAHAEKEKQQFVESQAKKVQQEADRETKRDTEELDTRFAQMVKKTGVVPSKLVKEPAASTAEKLGEPTRLAPVMPAESLPKIIPVISMDKKPVPQPEAAPPNLPVAPLAPVAPVMPPTSVAQQSAQQPSAAAPSAPQPVKEPTREVVSDVKFTPKLTGPVEELRSLNLKDYRRLSKDPTEATLKIKDKIDLLEEQSFELKSQGIKAWQDSEPNRLYLDMLRKSLEGKPVTEVISDWEAKGQPVLTKAEFDSLMALNRQLRFG